MYVSLLTHNGYIAVLRTVVSFNQIIVNDCHVSIVIITKQFSTERLGHTGYGMKQFSIERLGYTGYGMKQFSIQRLGCTGYGMKQFRNTGPHWL